jgi:hypothetical protein
MPMLAMLHRLLATGVTAPQDAGYEDADTKCLRRRGERVQRRGPGLSPNSSFTPVTQFRVSFAAISAEATTTSQGGHIELARAQGGQPGRPHQAEQHRGLQQRADVRRHQVFRGRRRAFRASHRDGIAQ